MIRLEPTDVFPAVGKPTHTYVERDSGENEKKLKLGLLNPGQICLVTGPSKTGKTSLYRQVLPEIKRKEIIVRCSGELTSSQFWLSALENLNFESIAEKSEKWGVNLSSNIGVNGEIGWPWLVKVLSSVGLQIGGSSDFEIRKELARSKLSAKHLIPLLSSLPVQLVIEDFHYLSEQVKKEVFQQWKGFIDEGVSVLVVSTTHHAADIARANADLSGRTRFIDVGQWDQKDLAEIPKRGFPLLGIKATDRIYSHLAKESVGLPIITQQICQEISANRDMSPGSRTRGTNVQLEEAIKAQTYVAKNMYANHKGDYEQLSTGPRKGARKHATYEKILASFALEPLKFALKFHELIERINRLSALENQKIPTGSITSALNALGGFQERNKLSLLDWHKSERVLYIIEPSFLFYLRQEIGSAGLADNFEEALRKIFLTIDTKLSDLKLQVKGMPMETVKLPLFMPEYSQTDDDDES